ncbi:MAG: YCF48-related protein [Arcicella sp.]|nr:YCF48-related protein [Arcicella sp.]
MSVAGSYDFVSYKVESPVFVGNSSFNESVKFINETTGFVGNNEGIFKTNDGGVTWSKVYNSSKSVKCISFINSTVGWAVGNQGLVVKTIDGGNNWTLAASITTPYALYKVLFKDSNNGLIVGDFGSIFTTSNGGNTWVATSTFNIALYPTFTSVAFAPNTSNIWAVGSQHPNGFIAKSSDNGLNWSQASVPVFNNKGFGIPAKLNDIVFTTSNNGWVVADDGLYRTTDGGITWQTQSTGVVGLLAAIQFVNTQVGFIVGNNNTTLLKTVDSGNTWKSLNTFAYANSLSFISEKLGWMTYNSTVVKYTAPQCSTTPAVLVSNCCNGLESQKSGSWSDPTTWSCNRVPTATDDVFINAGHTVTENSSPIIRAKTLTYRGGMLHIPQTTTLRLGNQ